MSSLPLRCACGAVRGEVLDASARTSNRVVCYCDDCQAYARFLGRDDLVDAHGGADIVQVAPSRLRVDEGREHLRVVRLSEKGLVRCYAACCRTPVGNTLGTARSPFVGIPARFVEGGGAALDARVGPPIGGIQGKFAVGGCPPGVAASVSLPVLARSVAFVLGNALRGAHRPSPFFDEAGRLTPPVQVLTSAERSALAAS